MRDGTGSFAASVGIGIGAARTLRPTFACIGMKLVRDAPSRCHSGWARPHTCGDLPPRSRKAPDRPGIRRLPLDGNRPRPSPTRSQQYRSRVVLESTLQPLASRDTALGLLMEGIPTLGIGLLWRLKARTRP